jgi:hypothetical protein
MLTYMMRLDCLRRDSALTNDPRVITDTHVSSREFADHPFNRCQGFYTTGHQSFVDLDREDTTASRLTYQMSTISSKSPLAHGRLNHHFFGVSSCAHANFLFERYTSKVQRRSDADEHSLRQTKTLVPMQSPASTVHACLWRAVASYETTCIVLAISFSMVAGLVS